MLDLKDNTSKHMAFLKDFSVCHEKLTEIYLNNSQYSSGYDKNKKTEVLICSGSFIYMCSYYERLINHLLKTLMESDIGLKEYQMLHNKIYGVSKKILDIDAFCQNNRIRKEDLVKLLLSKDLDYNFIIKENNFLQYEKDGKRTPIKFNDFFGKKVREIFNFSGEIIARRNTLIHRGSLVDSSYNRQAFKNNDDVKQYLLKHKLLPDNYDEYKSKSINLEVNLEYYNYALQHLSSMLFLFLDISFYEESKIDLQKYLSEIIEEFLFINIISEYNNPLNYPNRLMDYFLDKNDAVIYSGSLYMNLIMLNNENVSKQLKNIPLNISLSCISTENIFSEIASNYQKENYNDSQNLIQKLIDDKIIDLDFIYNSYFFWETAKHSSFQNFYYTNYGSLFNISKFKGSQMIDSKLENKRLLKR